MPAYQCRAFRKVTNVISIGALLAFVAALVIHQPRHQPDHQGYRDCIKWHPAKYCRITFLEPR